MTFFAGGLARRAQYIREVRQKVKNILLLDGGNALATEVKEGEENTERIRRRAELVLKVYEIIGYDGLNIGDNDLILGVKTLKTLQEQSKIAFLSANIKDKETRKPIFRPYLVKKIDGLRIGIIGLISPDTRYSAVAGTENYSLEDPIRAAFEIINGPLTSCDYVIALAHLNASEIELLVQMAPQISIIIGGQDRIPVMARRMNRTIWVQTDAFGLSIGKLDLGLLRGSSIFMDATQSNVLQKNIDEVQKKIEDPRYSRDLDELRGMKEMLIEQKKKMPDTTDANTYENSLTLLHPKMTSDPEIERLISSSKE